jgi:hypothetical protein
MHLRHAMMVASIAWFSSACTGSAYQGVRDYDHARYPEALEHLISVEPFAANWPPRDKARYALYRGLTHLALGDQHAAMRWLMAAKRAWNTDPAVLSDDERNRLAAAWAHLPR